MFLAGFHPLFFEQKISDDKKMRYLISSLTLIKDIFQKKRRKEILPAFKNSKIAILLR